MKTSLLCALLGLCAVSTAAAASADGSLPADIAAIPLCDQETLANAGFALTKNDRKTQCENTLKVKDIFKIPPTDTVTLKALCDNVACTAALKSLYPVLPDCRYKDWAFKLSVVDLLEFCGINPESIAAAGSGSGGTGSVGSGATNNTTTKPPATTNAPSSSGAGGNEFAPVGENPTPAPETTAPATAVPTTTPKSAAGTLYATTATAVMVVAAAAVVAL